jgi:hypothetical protein
MNPKMRSGSIRLISTNMNPKMRSGRMELIPTQVLLKLKIFYPLIYILQTRGGGCRR